jgi:arylsulfatase A-like enzyme
MNAVVREEPGWDSAPCRLLGLRGSRLASFALACIALLAACSAREQPDIILISVDTLRADRLGAYGYAAARTPVFDGLAERGRLFTQATTPLPRTTPALASLFTGLEPQNHGSREVGEPRRAGQTLAEVFASRGWVTVGVTANGVAGARERLDSGFAHFVEKEDLVTERAVYVTDAALAEISGVASDRPLFLWVHYVDPHYSYNPPADFDPGDPGAACREMMARVKRREIPKGALQSDDGGVASAALASCSQLYDAEVAYSDDEVGRLLAGLRREGRLDNAYVVFTSDHGENLGEARLHYEHGPSLHDSSLRVPLVIVGPGVEPGTDTHPILLQDLAPTLLALAGVPEAQRPAADGVDQSARVRGAVPDRAAVERIAFAESGSAMRIDYNRRPWSGSPNGAHCFHDARWSWCGAVAGDWTLHDRRGDRARDVAAQHPEVVARFEAARAAWQPGELRERSARDSEYKLLETPRLEGGWRRDLYDLAADPGETRDVSGEHPDVAARLGAALDTWLEELTPRAAQPSEADIEALRELGYVD